MEKISVKVKINGGDIVTSFVPFDLEFTSQDADYIRSNNLSSVEIEGEYYTKEKAERYNIAYGLGKSIPDFEPVLYPKLYEGNFVRVVREPQEHDAFSEGISQMEHYDQLAYRLANPVKDEELEAGKVMTGSEWLKHINGDKESGLGGNILEAYASYRLQAEKGETWISVNDRLPDSAVIVLCATNNGIFMGYVIEALGKKDGTYRRDWYSQPAVKSPGIVFRPAPVAMVGHASRLGLKI